MDNFFAQNSVAEYFYKTTKKKKKAQNETKQIKRKIKPKPEKRQGTDMSITKHNEYRSILKYMAHFHIDITYKRSLYFGRQSRITRPICILILYLNGPYISVQSRNIRNILISILHLNGPYISGQVPYISGLSPAI